MQKLIEKEVPDRQHSKLIEKSVHLLELTGEWLVLSQLQDEEIQLLIQKLDEGLIPRDLAKTYVLKEGALCRKIQYKSKTITVPIVPNAYKWVVTNSVHEALLHVGVTKTVDALMQRFWFKNMHKFVRKFIENCLTCKMAKAPSHQRQIELHPILKSNVPWHTIHVDQTGKLSGQNRAEYFIVSSDGFSKFTHLYYTKNLSAKSAITALEQLISLFGPPKKGDTRPTRLFYRKCIY